MEQGHSRRKLNLTGQKYGQLTVLGPAENVGSRTAWRCRCDCGKDVVVLTKRLRDGHTISCGCAKERKGPKGNLAGLTYIDGTCVEMIAARTIRKNNTSGVPGVDWQADKQRWRVSICFKGTRSYLGSYSKFEDAVKARKRGEEVLYDTFLSEFAQDTRKAAGG